MSISEPLLRAFVALEETLSFTRAAERCNVTQSSLSQMIRRLEAAVGKRLFDRDTHTVCMTVEGTLFALRAHRILSEIDDALTEMRDYAHFRKGKLSIAVNPSLVVAWLPSILEQFRRLYPGITIEVFDTFPARALQMLQDKSVEIVICPESGNDKWSVSRLVLRESYYLACKLGHPLQSKSALEASDFLGLPIIALMHTGSNVVYSNGVHQTLRQCLRSLNACDAGIEIEQLTSAAALVGAGLGCAIVPSMARAMIDTSSVALVPISQRVMMRDIYLVQREKLGLSDACKAFLRIAENSWHDAKQLQNIS